MESTLLVRLMAASGSLTARPIAHKMVNRPVDECAARRLGRMTGPRHSAESDERILGPFDPGVADTAGLETLQDT